MPAMAAPTTSDNTRPQRRSRPGRLPAGAAASRTMSLCPPVDAALPWSARMRQAMGWLLSPLRGGATPTEAARWMPSTRPWSDDEDSGARNGLLVALRAEFVSTIADLDGDTPRDLEVRLHLCTGVRELWNLRPALFQLVSAQRGQGEAQRRLAALDRHFPRRAAGGRIGLRSNL